MRYAKQLQILDGTNQIQRLVIARTLVRIPALLELPPLHAAADPGRTV